MGGRIHVVHEWAAQIQLKEGPRDGATHHSVQPMPLDLGPKLAGDSACSLQGLQIRQTGQQVLVALYAAIEGENPACDPG